MMLILSRLCVDNGASLAIWDKLGFTRAGLSESPPPPLPALTPARPHLFSRPQTDSSM